MFTEELIRLRELSDRLLYQQTKEDDPQIINCIDDVVMQVEELYRSIDLLKNIVIGENDGR
jgi:hypothetical protein